MQRLDELTHREIIDELTPEEIADLANEQRFVREDPDDPTAIKEGPQLE